MTERTNNLNPIASYLKDNEFQLEESVELDNLRGILVRSISGKLRLVIAKGVDEYERKSLYLQALSHDILGHVEEPLKSILFPIDEGTKLDAEELAYIRHAKLLAAALDSGSVTELWDRLDFTTLYSRRLADAQAVCGEILKIKRGQTDLI